MDGKLKKIELQEQQIKGNYLSIAGVIEISSTTENLNTLVKTANKLIEKHQKLLQTQLQKGSGGYLG